MLHSSSRQINRRGCAAACTNSARVQLTAVKCISIAAKIVSHTGGLCKSLCKDPANIAIA